MGPFPNMEADAEFLWLENQKTAVVEMAKASGITLLKPSELNPMKATTYGTGQIIAKALERKPAKILLAVGGSATVDGGVGAAAALGWKFRDIEGRELVYGGEVLEKIAQIQRPDNLALPPIEVLCDVDNPLCGHRGAAAVFGPQKGADEQMVRRLDDGLRNLADIVRNTLGIEIDIAHGGASGGLAAGAIAFMNAKPVSGISTFIKLLNLENLIKEADIIITGEGKFDSQSLHGKVVSGLAKITAKYGKKLYVLAGSVQAEPQSYAAAAIDGAWGCLTEPYTLEQILKEPAFHLKNLAFNFAKTVCQSRI
jgi:glycerate kinase